MSTATLPAPAHLESPPALQIGPITLDAPVVLAPMAGVTNAPFRRLCRGYGAGLYVSEMITTRALVERNATTMRLITHHESETPRSIQLYGVDPATTEAAVRLLVDEDRADHIDLNFGCPVPKVTRKGGGAALPWKTELFREIVTRAARAAGDVPLTVKMRKGIDTLEEALADTDNAIVNADAVLTRADETLERAERGIEAMCAAQGIELKRGLKSSALVEAEFATIRGKVAYLERDRYLAPDIEAMRHWALDAALPPVLLNILPSHA